MIDSYEVVIGTTAVNRAELHKKVFPAYVKFLEGVRVKWFINIDKVTEEEVDHTAEVLQELCDSPLIDLHIIKNEQGGTVNQFFSSVKNLSNLMSQHSPEYGYFWLEDDWQPSGEFDLRQVMETGPLEGRSYVQLAKRLGSPIAVSFNPGLWSTDLFLNRFVSNMNQVEEGMGHNPERTVVPQKQEGSLLKSLKSFKVRHDFRDIGRGWQKNQKIHRTFQKTR